MARRLGSVPRVLVGAPSYFTEHGMPMHPDDLEDHRFIGYRRPVGESRLEMTGDGRVYRPRMNYRFVANSVRASRELVIRGRGLYYGPLWAYEHALETGDVVQLLPELELQAYPLNAIYKPSAYVPAKIRQFIDRMVESVKSERSLRTPQLIGICGRHESYRHAVRAARPWLPTFYINDRRRRPWRILRDRRGLSELAALRRRRVRADGVPRAP